MEHRICSQRWIYPLKWSQKHLVSISPGGEVWEHFSKYIEVYYPSALWSTRILRLNLFCWWRLHWNWRNFHYTDMDTIYCVCTQYIFFFTFCSYVVFFYVYLWTICRQFATLKKKKLSGVLIIYFLLYIKYLQHRNVCSMAPI